MERYMSFSTSNAAMELFVNSYMVPLNIRIFVTHIKQFISFMLRDNHFLPHNENIKEFH